MALNTTNPLLKIEFGNKYVLVAIDHYYKWCETKNVQEHTIGTAMRVFEKEIICRFGIPKYVFIDNGGEWMAEFDTMCNVFGINHQFTTPQWFCCNGMVERMIKTLKHGLIVISTKNI